eukprot:12425173-Karenia_brevis.AAC.1
MTMPLSRLYRGKQQALGDGKFGPANIYDDKHVILRYLSVKPHLVDLHICVKPQYGGLDRLFD